MAMHDFTPFRSLAGGLLIGIAASVLYAGTGRTAGISGIVGGLFSRGDGSRAWRVQFIAGLFAGGLLLVLFTPSVFGAGAGRPLAVVALAGLLVGFGARLGGGCTSGHGVCGLSRLSARSLIATVTFIAAGMLTVWLARHFGVGA
jgi:uncharacterized membrane protein YedE/YeeE